MINYIAESLEVTRIEVIAFIKAILNTAIIPILITIYTSNLLNGILYIILIYVFYKVVLKNINSVAKDYFILTVNIMSIVFIGGVVLLLALLLM